MKLRRVAAADIDPREYLDGANRASDHQPVIVELE